VTILSAAGKTVGRYADINAASFAIPARRFCGVHIVLVECLEKDAVFAQKVVLH
jgi:hypothetical protein